MEHIVNFLGKLGKKKLIDGVTHEDIKLYQEITELMDSYVTEPHIEKSPKENEMEDMELFVKLEKNQACIELKIWNYL